MNNKKNKKDFEEEVILNSLGLLDNNEEENLLLKMNSLPPEEKEMIREFNNLTYLITQAFVKTDKDIAPPETIKDKLFEKINSLSNKNKSGFEFVFADSNEWIQHPEIEGVQIKRLSVNTDKGYLMILLKAAAGAEYPAHHHSGAEDCYVLEGDLYVEGKYLGPGDFHHAEGDSDHDPLRTKNGCTLLLVVDPKDY